MSTALYLLIIIEGALRKWVFPDWVNVLYFCRDPLVFAIYITALKYKVWDRSSALSKASLAVVAAGSALAILEVSLGMVEPTVGVYGWRNYFLYVPLPFVMAACWERADVDRLCRITLTISPVLAGLVAWQFASPAKAMVNAGLIEGGVYQPGVADDIVRTYGTFTSSAGQGPFVAACLAVCVAAMTSRKRFASRATIAVGFVSSLTMLGLSGSRSAFGYAAMVAVGSVVASALLFGQSRGAAKALAAGVGATCIAWLLIPLVFGSAIDALADRTEGAAVAEAATYDLGTLGRALDPLAHFMDVIPHVPPGGFGLGRFGNAFSLASYDRLSYAIHVEDDWSRHVAELGPAGGIAFILFRVCLTVWLGVNAAQATRRLGEPRPFLLFAVVFPLLLIGQITGQGSVNALGWFFTGVTLAAIRERPETGATLQPVGPSETRYKQRVLWNRGVTAAP
jgi:hypothetical protein